MKFTFKLSLTLIMLMVLTSLGGAQTVQENQSLNEKTIMRLGLEARIDPQVRNQRAQELATMILNAKTETVHEQMRPIQEALLLLCDRRVMPTLERKTIQMIDDALEKHITIEEIDRSVRLDRLSYVYGFFNHDVSPKEIIKYREQWASLSLEEKASRYPTYIHLFDLVCKPLSVGPLDSPQETAQALELAAPLLKQMVTQPPRPGTAFHEPSHAALVLGPLYERWADTADYGAIIQKHLGSREAFQQMLTAQLVGAQDQPLKLEKMEHTFYAYSGRYLANALARLNARSAVPALKKTLDVYQQTGAAPASIQYTVRALVALGDKDARAEFEKTLAEGEGLNDLAWLARNGQGETLQYALNHLGKQLNVDPSHALKAYFETQLAAMK
ncbi:MAG: hypothetical protein P9L94_04620 [Candidatus Hinthialibacter antarcticus]|nr:hypothetical protein [Candidatus Hinthialibacter antarcticus]